MGVAGRQVLFGVDFGKTPPRIGTVGGGRRGRCLARGKAWRRQPFAPSLPTQDIRSLRQPVFWEAGRSFWGDASPGRELCGEGHLVRQAQMPQERRRSRPLRIGKRARADAMASALAAEGINVCLPQATRARRRMQRKAAPRPQRTSSAGLGSGTAVPVSWMLSRAWLPWVFDDVYVRRR